MSFAGGPLRSQWSKHSIKGVSAARTKTTIATIWKMRFDTESSVAAQRGTLQPYAVRRAHLIPRFGTYGSGVSVVVRVLLQTPTHINAD